MSVSQNAAAAFETDRPFGRGNTTVTTAMGRTSLILHGRTIATKDSENGIVLSDGGFPLSKTTVSRLNALSCVKVSTRNGDGHIEQGDWSTEWTGKPYSLAKRSYL